MLDEGSVSCSAQAQRLSLTLLRKSLASLPQLRLLLTAVEAEKAALQRQVATLEARCAAQQQSIASLEAAAFQAVKVSVVSACKNRTLPSQLARRCASRAAHVTAAPLALFRCISLFFYLLQLSMDHAAVQAAYTASSEALAAAVKGAQAREAELAAAHDAAAADAAAAAATIEALTKGKAAVEAERAVLAQRVVDLEGALLAKSKAHCEEVAGMAAQLEAMRRAGPGTLAKPTAVVAPATAAAAGRAAPAAGKSARGGGAAQRRTAAAKAAAVVSGGTDDDADFEPDIVVGRGTKPALASGPPQPARSALAASKPAGAVPAAPRGPGGPTGVPAAWATALQGLFSSDSDSSSEGAPAAAKGPVKRVRFSK